MKALIIKASDCEYEEIKEINNINELKEIHKRLVIDFRTRRYENIDLIITIYDDYIE